MIFVNYSDALDNHLGFIIARLREGFDYSNIIEEDSEETVLSLTRTDSQSELPNSPNYICISCIIVHNTEHDGFIVPIFLCSSAK